MKQKATIGYYYKRALLPLLICTAIFAAFTLLTTSMNAILPATAFGFNGRFFWCAYMLFACKGFENLFDQQSVSRKTRFRALVGFLPFSVLVAVVNLLLCYGGVLLSNLYWQQHMSAYVSVSSAEMPQHLFLGLTGFSEYGSAPFLIALGILLHALSVMRGMLFGVLLARLFRKLPRRAAFLLALGGTAVFAAICFLPTHGSAPFLYLGRAFASLLYGNSGASSTISVLLADLLMLSFYLILLRMTNGTVFRQRPTFRKQITRAAVGIALIAVLGIGNVLLCTPTLVNALERTKTPAVTPEGKAVTVYAYEPDERAFQLIRLQKKLAILPAYRAACLSALVQNYYLNDTLEYLSYADGAAIYDELLQTFGDSVGTLSVDFPLVYPAADAFEAVKTASIPHRRKTEILANACLYFSSHGEPARAKHTYSAVIQPNSALDDRDVLLCEVAINSITIYLDNEQDRLWAAEQLDMLADRLEPYGSDRAPERARLRQSAADLRKEKIPDSETVTDAADF